MTLGMYHERESLGNRRYRHTQHLKPIAYLENGIYKLTDRNVVAYADGDYHHAVLTANMGVRIGDDGRYAAHPTREMDRYVAFGGPVVKVGGVWTSVGFADPERIGQSVLWARPQADMTLTHLGHGLKEEIALKGGYELEDGLIAFPVDLAGLTWDMETKALLADGEPVAWIREPIVYDADNQDDTRPITWELHSIAGQVYVLFHLPDLAGMTSPVVDPTLTLQPDAAAGKDSRILNGAEAANNYGVSIYLSHGIYTTSIRRSAIQFDLSALDPSVTVTSATLTLICHDAAESDDTVNLYYLKRDWVEGTRDGVADAPATGITWGRYDTVNNWQTAGADGANDRHNVSMGSFSRLTTDSSGTSKAAVLTPATVELWISGGLANNGCVLIADNEAASSSGNLYSSDHGTAGYHPELEVVYEFPSGGGMLLLGVG